MALTDAELTVAGLGDTPPGHPVAIAKGPVGYGLACGCGRWQAYVTGPSSARWARREYDEHLRRVGASE